MKINHDCRTPDVYSAACRIHCTIPHHHNCSVKRNDLWSPLCLTPLPVASILPLYTTTIVVSREKTCGGWVGKETSERRNNNPADLIQLWSKRDLDTVVGEMQLKKYWTTGANTTGILCTYHQVLFQDNIGTKEVEKKKCSVQFVRIN